MNVVTSLLVVLATLGVIGWLVVRPGRAGAADGLTLGERRRLSRRLPWWRNLDDRRRHRLGQRIVALRRDVPMIGADGLQMDDRRQLLVAAQIACCSLLPDPALHWLPDEVTVYPHAATTDDTPLPADLIEDLGELATGQPWRSQRLHVSWPALRRSLAGGPHNPLVRALTRWRIARLLAEDSGRSGWIPAFEQTWHQWQHDGPHDLIDPATAPDLPRFVGRAAELFFQDGDRLATALPMLYDLLAAAFDLETTPHRPSGHRTPTINTQRS